MTTSLCDAIKLLECVNLESMPTDSDDGKWRPSKEQKQLLCIAEGMIRDALQKIIILQGR